MTKQQGATKPVLGVLAGIAASAAVSVLGILVFALLLKTFNLSDSIIPVVDQVIKVVSILLGTLVAVNRGTRGLPGGLLVGAGYILAGMSMYMLLEGTLSPWTVMLGDLLLGSAVGAAGGVLIANLKK